MKQLFSFLLFSFFVSVSLAQNSIESLESKLNGNLTDSARIKLLVTLSKEYQYSNLKKSFEYAEKAISIADTKNLLWAKALTYHNIATFHSISGDFSSSAKYNDLSLSINFQLKDTVAMAKDYNNLGQDYASFGKYDEAYFYYTQSYRLASEKKDSLSLAIALHNMAAVFKELGQFQRALDYLKLSQRYSDAIHDYEGKAYNYDEIGDIYLRKEVYDSALNALHYSLKTSRSLKMKFNDLLPATMIKIAKTYLALKDNPHALAYYDTAYSLYQKIDNEFGQAQVELGRGIVYLKEKKFDQALKLFESSATIAHETNSWSLEIECYEKLAKLYEELGDFKKSLGYYKQYKELEDSLFSQGMQAKLLQDQLRFETASKEDQIKALTKLEESRKSELKKQEMVRNILVVVVALTVILLFSIYRSGQRRIRINKLLLDHQEEVKRRSQELEQLNQVKDKFFSIISHDLRSPINALSAILDMMDNNQIKPEEFSKLNKELRAQFNHTKTLINNLLDWALLQMDKLKIQQEKIDLKQLVEENFKLLGSLHMKEMVMINRIPSDTICIGDLNIVNLVLRNLILNSLKFTEEGGSIEASAKVDDNEIVVAIKDSGIGIKPEVQRMIFEKTSGYSTRGTANEKGTGLGLILCKEFVEKNGGRIWLESELGKGSTFYFTIKRS
ncbi:MAG: tetratricopeptide repeat-containing sensor histidine kinase [Bacteroidetes bacterium]|nr:tetratricopeptide repeat-containing sensor histidine kinase [Bacteroidota bacterium]